MPPAFSTPRRRARQADVARYVPCSESLLEKLRISGDGPPYAKIGKMVVYDLDDVDHWIEERKRHSTSEMATAAAADA